MDNSVLQIRMLGEFSIRLGAQEINDGDNRSRKVWLLLAHMVYCRKRPITTDEMSALLWSENEGSANPVNALKTTLHRVRASLDQLYPGAGHELILRRHGSYGWNPEFPVRLDIDEFDDLCKAGDSAEDEETRLSCWMDAIALYYGDFLPKLSGEAWVAPIAEELHQLYLKTVLATLPLLEARERWLDAVDVCRKAVELEPYNETLYRHLMRNLLQLNRQQEATAAYESMSELLLSHFGMMPSDETRALYREIIRTVNDRTIAPGVILDQLRESGDTGGALFCDYDFFKVIYHSVARSVDRNGNDVHIAMLSITAEDGSDLPRRSLDRAMENLREIVRTNLRRGDIASLCSVSQYILLLPQASYENSRMVCQRITKAFFRQYPHSPANINVFIQPLEHNP